MKLLIVEANYLEAQKTSSELMEYFSSDKCSIAIACTGEETLERIKKLVIVHRRDAKTQRKLRQILKGPAQVFYVFQLLH